MSRITVQRLDRFLAKRAEGIKAEMEHYMAEAARVPSQRDYYERMAATERCAWMEVRHLRDVIVNGKQDPNWTATPAALQQDGEG